MDLWNGRDWDAWIELWTPDCEWDSAVQRAVEGSAGSIYRGHDGWRAFIRENAAVWESTRVEVDEARRVGRVVFLVGRLIGMGRSGAESGASIGYAFELTADGRLRRGHANFDVAHAARMAREWAGESL